jgi:DNA-binding NtrC family response regulator
VDDLMKILVADDDDSARYALKKLIASPGRTIVEACDGKQAIDAIDDGGVDLVFLDLNMPAMDGKHVLMELQNKRLVEAPEVIVLTANDTVSDAVECIRLGAADFVTKPYEMERIRSITMRSQQRVHLQQRLADMQLQLESKPEGSLFDGMLGVSRVMQQLFAKISKSAAAALPVLIRGESGTGKELVARSIHARSDRASKPFVAVNTAAISSSLIESELFGHVKGSFTGADRDREGVFRLAHGGTLFLDEIGDMPPAIQTRLLRVLQEGQVQPVGSERTYTVDVRVVSATHQDLEQSIADKLFRQDLYYRLKGIELFVPPLRHRQEDIVLLAHSFLDLDFVLSSDAVSALLTCKWPGNVRELKQRVQAAAAMSESKLISAQDLGLVSREEAAVDASFADYFDLPMSEAKALLTSRFEQAAIDHALRIESNNISAAARRLGMHRQSLQQKMKQLESDGFPTNRRVDT